MRSRSGRVRGAVAEHELETVHQADPFELGAPFETLLEERAIDGSEWQVRQVSLPGLWA